ncbi:hypothetical protein I4U23_005650 [Adineta vaga]|nr:hypothetical protein I4U23_005650 [Adineta vaga]
MAFMLKGQIDLSLTYHLRALHKRYEIFPDGRFSLCISLKHTANLFHLKNEHALALQYYEKALVIIIDVTDCDNCDAFTIASAPQLPQYYLYIPDCGNCGADAIAIASQLPQHYLYISDCADCDAITRNCVAKRPMRAIATQCLKKRSNLSNIDESDKQCNEDGNYTFEELKSQENWFGPFCQYEIVDPDEKNGFLRPPLFYIINEQLTAQNRLSLYFDVIKNISLSTCYEGIQCHSIICLDWREICNGISNCEYGEDEPEECFQLELNQCQSDEYRCQSGHCIPKVFLVDFYPDCMDQSDEMVLYENAYYSNCYASFKSPLMWDMHICPLGTFSCGDGECSSLPLHSPSCANGRDLCFLEQIYRSSLTLVNENFTMDCWLLLMCSTPGYTWDFVQYFLDFNCEKYDTNDTELYNQFCPFLFEFQNHKNIYYPFVRFFYDRHIDSSISYENPTYYCFNRSYCKNFPIDNVILINGLTCFQKQQESIWHDDLLALQRIFSSCHSSHTLDIEKQHQLFYCNRTRKYISEERINDGIIDCYYEEDEFKEINLQIKLKLNLTILLECLHSTNWSLRVLTSDSDCLNKSDTWNIFSQNTYVPTNSKMYRELYRRSIYYEFDENCNGEEKLKIPIENETDETRFEKWNGTNGCLDKKYAGDKYCHCLACTDERQVGTKLHYEAILHCSDGAFYSPVRLCDSIRDCLDNEDELICPWFINRTRDRLRKFSCKNGTIIYRSLHCDEKIDCQPDAEDEWFCGVTFENYGYDLLDYIQEHPQTIINISTKNHFISNLYNSDKMLFIEETSFKKKRMSWIDNMLKKRYCNRGLMIKKRFNETFQCLCPSSYYGLRCEYQSERILITIQMDIPINLKRNQNQQETFLRLITCLMFNGTCLYYEYITYKGSMKHNIYLTYPRPPPKSIHENWSIRIDIYYVNQYNVDYKASWLYYIQYSFLPFNRLVLYLILNDPKSCNTLNCIHGYCQRYLNYPYHTFCHCHQHWSGSQCDTNMICPCVQGGKCLSQSSKPFCICPLGRLGETCHGWFNPCKTLQCLNGGICIPFDEREQIKYQCICPDGYSGRNCENIQNEILIQFSSSFLSNYYLKSFAILIHILSLPHSSPMNILSTKDRFFINSLSFNQSLKIFYEKQNFISLFVIIQMYSEHNQMDFYVTVIRKQPNENIVTIISPEDQLIYADQLLENKKIEKYSWIKKVKYYHYICQLKSNLKYFLDENYLCFCDSYGHVYCAIFLRDLSECSINYCQNNGQCISNNINGYWDFRCICQSCTFGSLCQLTITEFTLSLDIMIGRDILENTPIKHQPFLIKITIIVLILMFILGLIFNTLSFLTLKQEKVRQIGCGIYLYYLPFIGQFGLLILLGRFIYLLITQIYPVEYRTVTYWSCVSLEYFLNLCPILFDWLITFISLERLVNIIQGVSFNKRKSVIWAKRIIFILIIIILISSWHEFFSHQLIDDPRNEIIHTWCVVIFHWSWIKYYRLMLNLFHLFIPCIIQLFSTIILLHKSTKLKQSLSKQEDKKKYFHYFKQQLPFYGIPIILILFRIPWAPKEFYRI